MREALALGWRLGTRATGHGRIRSTLMLLVSGGGTIAVLEISAAVTRLDAAYGPGAAAATSVTSRLLSGIVVLAVVLPVLAIALSSGRMSASTRVERRERLLLLGMSRPATAGLAAAESAPWALGGWFLGLAVEMALHLMTGGPLVTGGALIMSGGVPLSIVAGACTLGSPRRATGASAARGPVDARTRWVWILPLLLGVLALLTSTAIAARGTSTRAVIVLFFAGAGLAAVGSTTLPIVTVRVLSRALVGTGVPSAVIAGRRLQARPAAMARVFAALLISLVVATAAQGLIAVFAQVPQYRAIEHQRTVQSRSDVSVPDGMDEETFRQRISPIDGIESVSFWRSASLDPGSAPSRSGAGGEGRPVVISTCAELHAVQPGIRGCSDEHASWIPAPQDDSTTLPVGELSVYDDESGPAGPTVTVDAVAPPLSIERSDTPWVRNTQGSLFVPRGLLNDQDSVALGSLQATILATPRIGLDQEVLARGISLRSGWALEDYRQIARIIDGIRLLSVVVLAIGMGGFLLLLVDRSLERRPEIARLGLAGIPRRTIRAAHVLEVLLPLTTGSLAALLVGHVIARAYVAIGQVGLEGDGIYAVPPGSLALPLIGTVVGCLVVTLVSGIGLGTRVRPRDLRRV